MYLALPYLPLANRYLPTSSSSVYLRSITSAITNTVWLLVGQEFAVGRVICCQSWLIEQKCLDMFTYGLDLTHAVVVVVVQC